MVHTAYPTNDAMLWYEWNYNMMILPRFEADDLELQDEPVQVRIMDYDAYSANDTMIWYEWCYAMML